jgi:hypothetical protein
MKTLWLFVALCAAIAVASTLALAQPDSLWSRCYGGWQNEYLYSVVQTEDGGYVLGAQTGSYGAGSSDVWLIKTNAQGDTVWCHTYGGAGQEWIGNAGRTEDGYFVTGNTWSYGAGGEDFWLVKTDADGNQLWSRSYGGAQDDQVYWGQPTSDGGYILAGYTYSYGVGGRDWWLVKTNANGDTLWTRTFGGLLHDGCTNVIQTADGGYLFSGIARSFGDPDGDFWLIKTNANGDSVWSHVYGNALADLAWCARQTTDGGYIVTGYTTQGNGITDVWLIKTDANGDSLWSRTYGTANQGEAALSVVQTSDNGYAMTGQTGNGAGGVLLLRTDDTGNVLWSRTFGGAAWEEAYDLMIAPDGGYVIAAVTGSYGSGNYDAWLIKTSPDPIQPVTWTQADDALHRFYRAGSGVLGNYFYCFGTTWPEDNASAQAFNLTTEQWEESTLPPVGTGNYAGVATNDAIYLIGGTTTFPPQYHGDVQKFTPTGGGPTGTWTAMADYPYDAYGMAVAWDGGNYIYAAGGAPNESVQYPYAHKYDIASDTWTQIADAPVSLLVSGGAFLFDRFYVAGGWAQGTDDQLLEYNPADNTWTNRTGPPIPIAFPGFGTTQNDSLMIVVAGGGDTPHSPLTTAVQAYDPLTDTWTQETPLLQTFLHASGNSARFVPPDKVISAGGYMLPPGECLSLTYLGTGFPGGAVAVDPMPRPLPTKFSLGQNYPNPFNATTTISFDLTKSGHISLRVFDLLGREVEALKDDMMEAGSHRVTFDGSHLASGIYFARLEAGKFSQTKKLIVLK